MYELEIEDNSATQNPIAIYLKQLPVTTLMGMSVPNVNGNQIIKDIYLSIVRKISNNINAVVRDTLICLAHKHIYIIIHNYAHLYFHSINI